MSRIEKAAAPTLQEIKREVAGAVKPSGRRFPKKLSCLAIVLLVMAAFVGWIAWFVASAGLTRLPLFTDWFYREPAPVRLVVPGVPLEESVSSQISEEATRRLTQGGGTIADRGISVKLAEESFTASLRNTLASSEQTFIDASRVQLAMGRDTGIELFIPVTSFGQTTALTVRLRLSYRDGNLTTEIEDVWIGARRLPSWLARLMFEPPLEAGLKAFNTELAKYVELASIDTFDGFIGLNGELIVEKLEIK